MNSLLQNNTSLTSPWTWALVAGALALWLVVPRGRKVRWQRAAGAVLGVVSVGIAAAQMPLISPMLDLVVFWILAAITVVSAAAMISMRSPVYSAIWFAMTLLGVAGLFLFQGAQFLAVATIVVYAGAIVVMFLFLIMLAQPQGHEYYDRITWGSPAALFSAFAGAAMVLILTTAVTAAATGRRQFQGEIAALLPEGALHYAELHRSAANETIVTVRLTEPVDAESLAELRTAIASLDRFAEEPPADYNVNIHLPDNIGGPGAQQHVAALGGVLFSRYLLAVEVAGTLLLVALVGAVVIVMHGRRQESPLSGGSA